MLYQNTKRITVFIQLIKKKTQNNASHEVKKFE